MKAAIGIDPGPTPGFGLLIWSEETGRLVRAELVQCSRLLAPVVLDALISCCPSGGPIYVQAETFVVGRRAGKLKTPKGGKAARELGAELQAGATPLTHGSQWRERTASIVKGWATTDRLAKAGLLELSAGSIHARDGLRHALFTACRDGGLTDPLSSSWKGISR